MLEKREKRNLIFFLVSFGLTYLFVWVLFFFIPPLFKMEQTPDMFLFLVLIFILGQLSGFLKAIFYTVTTH